MSRRYTAFVPLLLVVVTLVAMLGFRSIQLERDKQALVRLQAEQDLLLQQGEQARLEVESLSAGLARLAARGNADARAFVEMLQAPRL